MFRVPSRNYQGLGNRLGVPSGYGLFGSKKVSPAILPTAWPIAANVQLNYLDCVGEASHVKAIRAVIGDLLVMFSLAVLLPEPNNQHDPKAVVVYLSGKRVGYVSRQTVTPNRKAILRTIEKNGHAAVNAAVMGGDFPNVTLQPTRISRPVVTSALLQAGFKKKEGEKDWGFTMREEPAQTLVFCSGAKNADRDELIPQYATALTAVGIRARVDDSDGRVVRVEG